MALFKFNYKHHGTAFFFNALFTAVTFAIILVFNDQLDKYLAKQHYFHADTHPYVKGIVHAMIILIVTFTLTYVFRFVFGWGGALLGHSLD
jgi:hypothetical protein